jgi:RNA polymerase sigma factor (TIGR02999 family)
MRRILVDHARKRKASKREVRAEIENWVALPGWPDGQDLEVLHEALDRLAELDARKAKVVELRFFGGLTEQETADCLEISLATVQRDWMMARAWLFREMAASK